MEKVGEWANQRRSLNESLSDMVKVNDSNLSYTKSEMYQTTEAKNENK